jgi:orotate phosphoribosyltransferase
MRNDLLAASRARLLALLTERSFEKREVTLASGKKSNFYVDCKQTTLDAEGHLLVGRLLFHEIQRRERETGVRYGGVGGLTLGADPMASAVSMTSALAGAPIPAFIVRKEPKGHGTGAYIEGMKNLTPGTRVAIVEDVVTTGGSAEKAILRAREAGFVVDLVLGLVDRLEGGRQALEQIDVRLITLFTRTDFMPDEDTI